MSHGRWSAGAAAAVLAIGQARAQDGGTFALREPKLTQMEEPESFAGAAPAPVPTFGKANTKWWTVGPGVAYNFNKATDVNLRGAYSYFLVDDVEFSVELNGWYFDQPGDNAIGINPAMVVRWHFVDRDPWTLYLDVGIGLLLASDNVPDGGTSFDFTPRAGGGFTRRLDDAGTRLQVGLRWHHISNGRIFGDSSNPGRDALMLYAGIQWPF
jgi:hypothetical protein